MDTILKTINSEMNNLNIEYYYLYNNAPKVKYPYCTGEFTQNSYSFEDNSNSGDFLLEIWNRGSQTPLYELEKIIKEHFRDLKRVTGNICMHISFNSAFPVRTNEVNLYKLEIHLDINYWEGE